MQDIIPQLKQWQNDGKRFALATVIKTWGSAPRVVGSAMAVSTDMEMCGSVSGGCVENDVVRAALLVLESGESKVLEYGVSDEDAWSVGLSCGGQIRVFVEPFIGFSNEANLWERLYTSTQNNEGCILVSGLRAGRFSHALVYPDGRSFGDLKSDAITEIAIQKIYKERKNQLLEIDDMSYFAQVFPPKSQVIIVGAAHLTADLVHLAHQFDFETIVIDPRGIFTQKTYFPTPPDHSYEDWPAEVLPKFKLDNYTYAVLLTHDPKIDDQAIHLLLRSDVAYIGALGGRKTQSKRRARLLEAGFSATEIDRIHGPVGIDINAKKPREIALSILAQIIQERNRYL